MRVEIACSVANDPNAHQWLDRILHKIDDGWHVWDLARLSDPTVFQSTPWISGRGTQGDWVTQILVASIKRGAWSLAPHERRLRVTTHPATANELEPEDAARLAEEPLTILVENRVSDGAFVERVTKELDNRLRSLWKQPGDPVRFDSVGGVGQMLAEVERRSLGRSVRPRLVVISDSDRTHPNATDNTTVRRLRTKCEKLNLSCWVLAKRESENYLPRILLSERKHAGPDHGQMVDAWDKLNDDQKNFFDMKNGLPNDLSAAEKALFQGLTSDTRTLLSRGFGNKVYKCWTLWHVQAKTALRRRGQGDLERGIALIRKEV